MVKGVYRESIGSYHDHENMSLLESLFVIGARHDVATLLQLASTF
jgi:hypothetical protein